MSEQASLSIDSAKLRPLEEFDRLRGKALIVGLVGAVATAAGYFLVAPEVFHRAYLVGWIYWLGVALGLFTLSMINHLAGGRFGIQMRRVQEAAGRTVPVFLLLALPFLVFGMDYLYSWTPFEAPLHDALLAEKSGYLKLWFDFVGNNPEWMKVWVPGFYPRLLIYFALWSLWAYKMSSLSHQHDATGDEAIYVRQQKWAAGGIVVFVMVGTFAVIDLIMSTDPHWFSSLYGPQLLMWQLLSALAFSVPLMIFLARHEPLKHLVKPTHYHDYGKLMLAFTMVWGYFSVSQFLIIWSGNMPEEITWYITRNTPAWKWYTVTLVIFAFFLPFAILLSQDIKFKPRILMKVAFLISIVRFFDYYWQIAPNLSPNEFPLHVFDFVPVIAIGGLWVWLLLGQFRDRAMVAVEDPVIKEAWADG